MDCQERKWREKNERRTVSECAVIARIAEHLREIIFGIRNGHVSDVAVLVKHRGVDRVHKALVRSYVEFGIAVQYLFVEIWVNLHGVCLNEVAAGFIVAFALDALHFAEELAEKISFL